MSTGHPALIWRVYPEERLLQGDGCASRPSRRSQVGISSVPAAQGKQGDTNEEKTGNLVCSSGPFLASKDTRYCNICCEMYKSVLLMKLSQISEIDTGKLLVGQGKHREFLNRI